MNYRWKPRNVRDAPLRYYARNAAELVRRYEEADVGKLQRRLVAAFEPGARLLELGCGSGRDVAFMLANGFDVLAADGSPTMLEHALRLHPDLAGRVECLSLPAVLPYTDACFDGAYALAVLMHLDRRGITSTVDEVGRVLRRGGRFFMSVPSTRSDLGKDGRDASGRLFTSLAPDEWVAACEARGFRKLEAWDDSDGLGRLEVRWFSLVLAKR